MRRLIVNADDFGQSAGINEGIIECHELGIVSSASLMVRWPCAPEAAEYARAERALSVGLHIDLGEWVYRSGEWVPLYTVVPLDDSAAIGAEITDQLETFRRLMKCDPTHIDSHQHVHDRKLVSEIVVDLGARLKVPVRHSSDQPRHLGEFYGQGRKGCALPEGTTVEHLIGLLSGLPDGTTELGCHPGMRGDAPGTYVAEREQEVRVLCDPGVRATLQSERIELISFRELASDEHRAIAGV